MNGNMKITKEMLSQENKNQDFFKRLKIAQKQDPTLRNYLHGKMVKAILDRFIKYGFYLNAKETEL